MGRLLLRLFAPLSCAAWIGCNAILGNESAVFAPPDSGSGVDDAADGPGSSRDSATSDRGSPEDAGPCIDEATNPKHCGRCNHDCLGGACAGGACQPFVLAPDQGTLLGVAVDATHVYWGNRATGDIMRVRLIDGMKERVYDGPAGVDPGKDFALYGEDVYFALVTEGAIARCPKAGCIGAPEILIPDLDEPDFVSVIDGNLVFTELSGGVVGRCTLPVCQPTRLSTTEVQPLRATVEGDLTVWSALAQPKGGVLRAKLGAGAPFDVASGDRPYAVAIVGDEIVYASLSNGPRAIRKDGGGPIRTLSKLHPNTSYLAVDGDTVYFNDVTPIGRFFGCPLSGCDDGGAPLATDQPLPGGIAVDDRSIYWAAENALMRLAK